MDERLDAFRDFQQATAARCCDVLVERSTVGVHGQMDLEA